MVTNSKPFHARQRREPQDEKPGYEWVACADANYYFGVDSGDDSNDSVENLTTAKARLAIFQVPTTFQAAAKA